MKGWQAKGEPKGSRERDFTHPPQILQCQAEDLSSQWCCRKSRLLHLISQSFSSPGMCWVFLGKQGCARRLCHPAPWVLPLAWWLWAPSCHSGSPSACTSPLYLQLLLLCWQKIPLFFHPPQFLQFSLLDQHVRWEQVHAGGQGMKLAVREGLGNRLLRTQTHERAF